MKVIQARNVNDAYTQGWEFIKARGARENTRNGPAYVASMPVTTVYEVPTERVLFDARRKANPFFHFFESLWMLAGRNDSKFLNLFVRDFGARYAQSNGVVHGAYGQRWIHHFWVDQLEASIKRMSDDPDTRQCVIAMWDPRSDIFDGDEPIKDRPCNTHIYLRNFSGALDMTVCCRSNDMIWGCYGANAVHFSILQEYLASRLDMAIGTYYQISNNFHAYGVTLDSIGGTAPYDPYVKGIVEPYEFWSSAEEAKAFSAIIGTWLSVPMLCGHRLLDDVALPMYEAFSLYRSGNLPEAIGFCEAIKAADWRLACKIWLGERVKK